MTLAQTKGYVWRRLGVRKHLVGRAVVDDLVELAIENWAGAFLNYCQNDNDRRMVCGVILDNMRRSHQVVSGKAPAEYGVVWAFILQAVASAVVQVLLRWWLERRANRVLLLAMKAELTT
jgi:hypothetical protein